MAPTAATIILPQGYTRPPAVGQSHHKQRRVYWGNKNVFLRCLSFIWCIITYFNIKNISNGTFYSLFIVWPSTCMNVHKLSSKHYVHDTINLNVLNCYPIILTKSRPISTIELYIMSSETMNNRYIAFANYLFWLNALNIISEAFFIPYHLN